jgi:hypothetical protein
MNRWTAILGSASILSVLAGVVYIGDCRANAKGLDQIDRCYLTGLPIMGLGATGAGAFQAGYNTYNPALRKKRDDDTIKFGQ